MPGWCSARGKSSESTTCVVAVDLSGTLSRFNF